MFYAFVFLGAKVGNFLIGCSGLGGFLRSLDFG